MASEFKSETKSDISEIFNQFDYVLSDIDKLKVLRL